MRALSAVLQLSHLQLSHLLMPELPQLEQCSLRVSAA